MLPCICKLFSFIFTIKEKVVLKFKKKMILGKTKDDPGRQNTSASL